MFFKKEFKGYSYEDFSFLKLKSNEFEIPAGGNHPGSFGFKRKNHIHEGIDIYCSENDIVYSISEGTVIKVDLFTGKEIGSPWWNTTSYIAIENKEYVFVYGELESFVKEGDIIEIGMPLGKIIPVLKEDKGRPLNMLHFEVYLKKEFSEPKEWIKNKPKGLLDPILILKEINL